MLRIGQLELEVPFVQAALSGYSDLAMRRMARRFGAQYALNEVVLDKTVLHHGKKQREILSVEADDHPVGGQLMGANPDQFGPAAAAMAEAGYDVIDINFGCPVRKVLGRCRGGFLLSEPRVALEIVRRVYDAVGGSKPVTVKMRRGTDDSPQSERNFFTILDGAFEIGVAAVTVHGRTVDQRYTGPSRWSFLEKVKRYVGDRVILGSGDLFSAEACLRMMNETGVDGVTIARGSIGNPWIFRECLALLAGEPLPPPPSVAEQGRVIAEHFAQCAKVHGSRVAPKLMRKFGIKYSEHHPHARAVRISFVAVKSEDEFQAVLDHYYDPQKDWLPVERRKGHGDLVAAGATA
ncbi:MAG: tRNA-dihydrouridine synthase [Planctomycetes bacterium]|nr:tRNA-dihydrouridine synthase [Planctomycetota bacterium]